MISNCGSVQMFLDLYIQRAGYVITSDSYLSKTDSGIGEQARKFFLDIWVLTGVGWFISILTIVDVIVSLFKGIDRQFLWMIFGFFPGLLFTFFYSEALVLRYMNPFIPFMCIFVVYTIYGVSRMITENDLFLTVLLTLLLIVYAREIHEGFSEFRHETTPAQHTSTILMI